MFEFGALTNQLKMKRTKLRDLKHWWTRMSSVTCCVVHKENNFQSMNEPDLCMCTLNFSSATVVMELGYSSGVGFDQRLEVRTPQRCFEQIQVRLETSDRLCLNKNLNGWSTDPGHRRSCAGEQPGADRSAQNHAGRPGERRPRVEHLEPLPRVLLPGDGLHGRRRTR